jgi:acyl carrier protein
MGLESVEIILLAEEEFGMDFPDEDLGEIRTTRQFADYIFARRHQDVVHCQSQAAFYHLRRALVTLTGVPRRQLRPDMRIAGLLPQKGIRAQWKALGRAINAKRMPRLRVRRSCWLIPLVQLLVFGFLLHRLAASPAVFWWASFGLLLANWAWLSFCRGDQIPPGLDTLRDLVPLVPIAKYQDMSREEILQGVTVIVANGLGLDVAEVLPDARLVEDLGMG